jgi:hypothetical protein
MSEDAGGGGGKPGGTGGKAYYETGWKDRNPSEAREVADRLARLKAGTWASSGPKGPNWRPPRAAGGK